MRTFFPVLSLLVISSAPAAWAQLRAPNEAGVAMGQVYSIVRDVDATKKFWILMGGTPVTVDGMEAMKFPGVFVFLAKGEPTGSNTGTPLDHVGFWVTDGPAVVAKLKAAGVRTDADAGVRKPGVKNVGYVYTADDLKIEIMEDQAAPQPVAFDHLHGFLLPPDAQAWYAKMFGTQPIAGRPGQAMSDLAGTRILFGKPAPTLLPTKGRSIDHVGFEVKDLQAFCKKLEADGVKFDEPYSKSRHKGFASATLTDPWGISIELTEGLNRF